MATCLWIAAALLCIWLLGLIAFMPFWLFAKLTLVFTWIHSGDFGLRCITIATWATVAWLVVSIVRALTHTKEHRHDPDE